MFHVNAVHLTGLGSSDARSWLSSHGSCKPATRAGKYSEAEDEEMQQETMFADLFSEKREDKE